MSNTVLCCKSSNINEEYLYLKIRLLVRDKNYLVFHLIYMISQITSQQNTFMFKKKCARFIGKYKVNTEQSH